MPPADMATPTVQMTSRYVGTDALSVEQGVTSLVEQKVKRVENIDVISSTAPLNVQNQVDQAQASLVGGSPRRSGGRPASTRCSTRLSHHLAPSRAAPDDSLCRHAGAAAAALPSPSSHP